MKEEFVTKDSGQRHEFGTGAVRDVPTGKGRFDLISPIAMRRLAGVLERGAAKYSPRNWEKGIPLSSFINSAIRHINQYMGGEADEDHLAQALWNIHSAIHTEDRAKAGKLPRKLLDIGPAASSGELIEVPLNSPEQLAKFLGTDKK